jgi:hypothetical protein
MLFGQKQNRRWIPLAICRRNYKGKRGHGMSCRKRNEIPASEWEKTLTEEQLNKRVVLRDNWGDVVVSGSLRNMIKNKWIEPFNGIDLDKTDIEGGDVYLGTIYMESEVAKRREDIEKSQVDCSTPSVTDSKGDRE